MERYAALMFRSTDFANSRHPSASDGVAHNSHETENGGNFHPSPFGSSKLLQNGFFPEGVSCIFEVVKNVRFGVCVYSRQYRKPLPIAVFKNETAKIILSGELICAILEIRVS